MVGFFKSYLVDALTRLDVVGQTGNVAYKAALFIRVTDIIFLDESNPSKTYKCRPMRPHFMTSTGKHHGKSKMFALCKFKFTFYIGVISHIVCNDEIVIMSGQSFFDPMSFFFWYYYKNRSLQN